MDVLLVVYEGVLTGWDLVCWSNASCLKDFVMKLESLQCLAKILNSLGGDDIMMGNVDAVKECTQCAHNLSGNVALNSRYVNL